MYKRLKILLWISLVLNLLGFGSLWAVNDDAGTTGFAPLKIVMSARAEAMGQAMMGLTKNPDGMQFNPASILKLPSSEISSTYTNHFVDTQGGALQYVWTKDPFIAWGFMLKYMNFGSMERTEISQQGDLVETGEFFGAQNLIAGITMARFISPMIDLGGTVKVVYDQIDDSSASAAMIDVGLIHHPENERIKVGVGLRNVGLQLSHYSDTSYKESLPFTASAGISYIFGDNLQSSLDVSKVTGENLSLNLGLEYRAHPNFLIRGGFATGGSESNLGGSLGWTSGASLGAAWDWRNYQVSYSLSSGGDLGMKNQLSLNYRFK